MICAWSRLNWACEDFMTRIMKEAVQMGSFLICLADGWKVWSRYKKTFGSLSMCMSLECSKLARMTCSLNIKGCSRCFRCSLPSLRHRQWLPREHDSIHGEQKESVHVACNRIDVHRRHYLERQLHMSQSLFIQIYLNIQEISRANAHWGNSAEDFHGADECEPTIREWLLCLRYRISTDMTLEHN